MQPLFSYRAIKRWAILASLLSSFLWFEGTLCAQDAPGDQALPKAAENKENTQEKPAAPPAEKPEPGVDLYTIGPGTETFSAFGHSVLCVNTEQHPEGLCYDYGVPDSTSPVDIGVNSLRGKPIFVPVEITREVFLNAFKSQDRDLWRQKIPLSPQQITKVADTLADAAHKKISYAYHPHYANCTTKLRDVIDDASGGVLKEPSTTVDDRRTYRTMMEEGFSGRMFHLTALTLTVGPGSDRVPNAFEAMCLPSRFMAEIKARFASEPEVIKKRFAPSLPTSPNAGRITLVFIGLLLTGALYWGWKKGQPKWQTATHIAGAVLGLFSFLPYAAAISTVYPELIYNWAPLVLWPTDLGIGWMKPTGLRKYLMLRLGVLALALLASLSGVIKQPMGALVLFAALPLGFAFFKLQQNAPPTGVAAEVPPEGKDPTPALRQNAKRVSHSGSQPRYGGMTLRLAVLIGALTATGCSPVTSQSPRVVGERQVGINTQQTEPQRGEVESIQLVMQNTEEPSIGKIGISIEQHEMIRPVVWPLEDQMVHSPKLRSQWYNPMPGGILSGYSVDTGLDIAGFKKPVYAIAAGTLDYSEKGHTRWTSVNNTQYSIRLKLDSPVTWKGRKITHVYYGHLFSVVKEIPENSGTIIHVEAGQQLGVSGWANGSPHLHLGLLLDNHVEQDSWDYLMDEKQIRDELGLGANGQRM